MNFCWWWPVQKLTECFRPSAVGYAAVSTTVSNIFTVVTSFFCHRTVWWRRHLVWRCKRLSRWHIHTDCTWNTDIQVGRLWWWAGWIGWIFLTTSAAEQCNNISYRWTESFSGIREADLSRVWWYCIWTSLWDSLMWGLQSIFQTHCPGSVFICKVIVSNYRFTLVIFWLLLSVFIHMNTKVIGGFL